MLSNIRSSSENSAPSAEELSQFLATLDSGIDFGVATLWCCPNSCANSQFEAVYIQAPPDIGI